MNSITQTNFITELDGNILAATNGISQQIELAASSDSLTWLSELKVYADKLVQVTQTSIMMQAALLSKVKELWEADKINPKVTEEWDFDFYKFAIAVSHRRVKEPSKKTIQAWVSTYEFFIRDLNKPDGFILPKTIFIPSGKVDVSGEPEYNEVVPDLSNSDFSKLLIAKGLAKSIGNLDDELIYMLVTPDITCREVETAVIQKRQAMKGIKPSSNGKTDGRVKEVDWRGEVETSPSEGNFLIGDTIWFTHENTTVPLWHKATDGIDPNDEIVKLGYNYTLTRLGIPDDYEPSEDDYTYLNTPYVFRTEDDKILLTVMGHKFHEFGEDDIDVLEAMYRELGEVLGKQL